MQDLKIVIGNFGKLETIVLDIETMREHGLVSGENVHISGDGQIYPVFVGQAIVWATAADISTLDGNPCYAFFFVHSKI